MNGRAELAALGVEWSKYRNAFVSEEFGELKSRPVMASQAGWTIPDWDATAWRVKEELRGLGRKL